MRNYKPEHIVQILKKSEIEQDTEKENVMSKNKSHKSGNDTGDDGPSGMELRILLYVGTIAAVVGTAAAIAGAITAVSN